MGIKKRIGIGLLALLAGCAWASEVDARANKKYKRRSEQKVPESRVMLSGDPHLMGQYEYLKSLKPHTLRRTFASWMGYLIADKVTYPLLNNMIEDICQELAMPTPLILVFRGTPYSQWEAFLTGADGKCNAFATSLSHTYSIICIGSDLLKYLSYDEVRAVMAHELAHVKHNHVRKKIVSALIFGLGYTATASFPVLPVVNLMSFHGVNFASFNVWGSMARGVFDVASAGVSRKYEKEADLTARAVTHNPELLINALDKIHEIYARKHPVWARINNILRPLFFYKSSHPSHKQRARYLRNALSEEQRPMARWERRRLERRKKAQVQHALLAA